MNIVQKCQYLIELGYTYDKESGKITSPFGVICNSINDRYLSIRINKKSKGIKINLYHHQFAWYCVYGVSVECIDHINQNKLDNRICNLREVTFSENAWNQKKNSKGYSKIKDNLYQARIKINGRLKSLGYFNNEKEAYEAYILAKKLYHKWK